MEKYSVYTVLLYPPKGSPRVAEISISFASLAEYKRAIKKGSIAQLPVQIFEDVETANDALEKAFAADPELRQWKNGRVI